jgi:hypothetical protein
MKVIATDAFASIEMEPALALASPATSRDRDTLKCEDCRRRKVKASHRPQDNPVLLYSTRSNVQLFVRLLNLADDSAFRQTETGLGVIRNALNATKAGIPVAPGFPARERQSRPTLKY